MAVSKKRIQHFLKAVMVEFDLGIFRVMRFKVNRVIETGRSVLEKLNCLHG